MDVSIFVYKFIINRYNRLFTNQYIEEYEVKSTLMFIQTINKTIRECLDYFEHTTFL